MRSLPLIGLSLGLLAGIALSVDPGKTDSGVGPPTAVPPAMPLGPGAAPGPEPSLFPPGGIPKLRSGAISRTEGPSQWPRTGSGLGPQIGAKPRPPSPEEAVLAILSREARAGSGFGPTIAAKPGRAVAVSRPPRNWIDQTPAEADAKSAGCMDCHTTTDAHTMHASPNVVLGCTDCHGGNPKRGLTTFDAHVQPMHPEVWTTSANPPNSSVALNHESPEFIRFINPGDLRAAKQACGLCHSDIVERVGNSMMNHGAMLWNAAAYNNGVISVKNAVVGQAYGADGVPLTLNNPFKPTEEETRTLGILPSIGALHRFNLSQPGNLLRIF